MAVDEAVVKVRTGTSARLGCSVEAFPDPVIVWVSQDNRAVTNSKSPTQLVIWKSYIYVYIHICNYNLHMCNVQSLINLQFFTDKVKHFCLS